MCEREACKAKTKFQWIKGHSNNPGNIAADQLAVQGSRQSTPRLRGEIEFSTTLVGPIKTREEWEQVKKQENEDKEEDAIFDSVSAELSMDLTSSYFTSVNAQAQGTATATTHHSDAAVEAPNDETLNGAW